MMTKSFGPQIPGSLLRLRISPRRSTTRAARWTSPWRSTGTTSSSSATSCPSRQTTVIYEASGVLPTSCRSRRPPGRGGRGADRADGAGQRGQDRAKNSVVLGLSPAVRHRARGIWPASAASSKEGPQVSRRTSAPLRRPHVGGGRPLRSAVAMARCPGRAAQLLADATTCAPLRRSSQAAISSRLPDHTVLRVMHFPGSRDLEVRGVMLQPRRDRGDRRASAPRSPQEGDDGDLRAGHVAQDRDARARLDRRAAARVRQRAARRPSTASRPRPSRPTCCRPPSPPTATRCDPCSPPRGRHTFRSRSRRSTSPRSTEPVIVLSDQRSRSARRPWTHRHSRFTSSRAASPSPPSCHYVRYRITEFGVSPISRPGQAGGNYLASGIEHNERGAPRERRHARAHGGEAFRKLRPLKRRADLFELVGDSHAPSVSSPGAVSPASRAMRSSSPGARGCTRACSCPAALPDRRGGYGEFFGALSAVLFLEQSSSASCSGSCACTSTAACRRALCRPGPTRSCRRRWWRGCADRAHAQHAAAPESEPPSARRSPGKGRTRA